MGDHYKLNCNNFNIENNSAKHIGRAKTVLVSRQSQDLAVVSEIIARVINSKDRQRISFTGLVEFSEKSKKHITDDILILIDRITALLAMSPLCYEISAVNPDIASNHDTSVDVNGFSADLSIFAAMLSASLRIPLPANILMTGHIASLEGDIGTVGSIQTKVNTAAQDKSIKRLIYPEGSKITKNFDSDSLQAAAVSNIRELVKIVFSEEDIVVASLEKGFFANYSEIGDPKDYVAQIIKYLAFDNENRFWQILRKHLLMGDAEAVRKWLRLFAGYYIGRKIYPAYFGDRLFSLICATPPAVKRAGNLFPLLDVADCIKLAGFAHTDDYEDVYKMIDAIRCKTSQNTFKSDAALRSAEFLPQNGDDNIFDRVTARINEISLARNFCTMIDSARASFILDSVTVGNYEDFLETVTSFYIHLQCYENSKPAESIDQQRARNEAIELLENSFRDAGGMAAALQRARDGTDGGMRKILDEMTDFHKLQQQQRHITATFRQAVDSLSWDERVQFMKDAMDRLKIFIPEHLKDEHPERFARDYETIAKAYVKGMDKLNQLIRRY
ncbi:MAG: hypothetical protein A2Y10_20300 [Planctomycetes bacterium GWF2_41_51]|nr:MAG: hypothetical protein A2Y10_20300 [Planctomycetes bacterium GWF2_41_51]HBG25743.1 hypothetical protein [Phycisphaerales bacterium]